MPPEIIETLELPQPTIPDFPTARVPLRYAPPVHPLSHYTADNMMFHHDESPISSKPAYNPDMMYGAETYAGAETGLHRERYGPDDHQRLIELQAERGHYAKLIEHGHLDQ